MSALNIFSQHENDSNTKLAFPTFFTYLCGAERKEGRKQKTPSKMKLRLFTTACCLSPIAYFWGTATCSNALNFSDLHSSPNHAYTVGIQRVVRFLFPCFYTRATIFGT